MKNNIRIDKEKRGLKMTKLTNKELETLLTGFSARHTDLIKWLYDNHRNILREWEATQGDLRIEFI